MSYRARIIYLVFGVAAVLYVLQAFTPLRLTMDGINYLSLADSAARNGFWSVMLQPGFPFPKGYPAFAFVLMKAGVFSSATLVAANLLLFAVGLFFSFRVLLALKVERVHAWIACLFSLLAFSAVKFMTQGMSDFLFFALSACVCWLLTLEHPSRWFGIAICTAAAVEVRFAGLALILPILVVAWPSLRKRPAIAIVALGFTLAVGIAGVLAGQKYLLLNRSFLRTGGFRQFAESVLHAQSQDFGELVGNVPFSKVPGNLHPFLLTVGFLSLLVFLTGVVGLRKRSLWLCCYLAGYSGMVMAWPLSDPRYWVAVMPFVVLAFREGVVLLLGIIPKRPILAYAAYFAVLGFLALGYSTRLTFASPERFAYEYGDGLLTNTYLSGCNASDVPGETQALLLLQRYEWHCPVQHPLTSSRSLPEAIRPVLANDH